MTTYSNCDVTDLRTDLRRKKFYLSAADGVTSFAAQGWLASATGKIYQPRSVACQRAPHLTIKEFSILALLVLVFGLRPGSAIATTPPATGEPVLRITQVNTAGFPEVKLFISGENLGAPLDSLPLQVKEDGLLQQVTDREPVAAGLQVAFLLAFSNSSREDNRPVQVAKSVADLDRLGLFSPDKDRCTLLLASETGYPEVAQDWAAQFEPLVSALSRSRPAETRGRLPLFNVLDATLNNFSQASSLAGSTQKILILFSDGLDSHSDVGLDYIADKATRLGVKIHTVTVGPRAENGNLRQLAAQTNGEAFDLVNADDDLAALWHLLPMARNQLALTYRSKQARPQTVSVELDGRSLQATVGIPSLSLAQAQVQLYQVTGDVIVPITRTVTFESSTDVGPALLPLQVELAWTDGFTRSIAAVEAVIDGQVIPVKFGPLQRVVVPLTGLPAGDHTLQIGIEDEVGVKGQSAEIKLEIIQGLSVWWWLSIAGVVAAAAIFAVGGLAYYRHQTRQVAAPAPRVPSGVQLALVKGQGPSYIELCRGKNRLGRDPKQQVHYLISDPSVSGLQCRIDQEGEGQHFRLWNNSKFGTRINGRSVDEAGHLLKSGDIIQMGRVEYRYEPVRREAAAGWPADHTQDWLQSAAKSRR